MESDEQKGFDWEVPVVREGRQLFDQGAPSPMRRTAARLAEGQDPAEDLRLPGGPVEARPS